MEGKESFDLSELSFSLVCFCCDTASYLVK